MKYGHFLPTTIMRIYTLLFGCYRLNWGYGFIPIICRAIVIFKVGDDQQNLHRAIGQFKLCTSIMKQEADIKSVISRLSC